MYLETEGKISQAVPNFLKHYYFRSSHLRCSLKKDVLRNFAKFSGKCLYQRLLLNKVAGLAYPATLFKKNLWHSCFPVNFVKFLRTPFSQNTSERLFQLFPYKTVYSFNNSHNACNNANANSKFI